MQEQEENSSEANRLLRSKNSRSGQFVFVGVILGVMLGFLAASHLEKYFETASNFLLIAFILIFVILAAIIALFVIFKDKIFAKIFGEEFDTIEKRANTSKYLIDLGQELTLKYFPNASVTQIKDLQSKVAPNLKVLIWSYLRTWWLRVLTSVFVAIGGMIGALLLYNQNELINVQNNLVEAQRRSSYVFLMSNILDRVDDEINLQFGKDQKIHISQEDNRFSLGYEETSGEYGLSKMTIGRIVALSKAFQPYFQFAANNLSNEMRSPERGQLLTTLSFLNLRDEILEEILSQGDFTYSVASGIDLSYLTLEGVDLRNSDLSNVGLEDTKISLSNFSGVDFQGVILDSTSFEDCNLQGIRNYSIDEFLKCKSLYKSRLPIELREAIEKRNPCLLLQDGTCPP